MLLKKLLVAVLAMGAGVSFYAPKAQASVALLHCKAATNGVELFVPFTRGGVNPIVGTVRLVHLKQTFVEASNDTISDYTNSGDALSFTVIGQDGNPVMKADFKYNEARRRTIGTVLYRHFLMGMVCEEE